MSKAILESLYQISDALERHGPPPVPPLSPYWRAECERFYLHPSARLQIECVGRGGDKSRTSVMMALAEVLSGTFRIPPGERHYFTHISENVGEANKTLGVLQSYLEILKVPYTRGDGGSIDLVNMPRGFRVLPCRIGAVSGWRCIGWTADECAKWSSDGVDPSSEVVTSIKAMTVTHPSARGRMISSPLGCLGYFYEMWERGSDETQVTGQAASWIGNPSVTEHETRQLESDPMKFQREYAAIPSEGSDEAMYPVHLIDRARRATEGDAFPSDGSPYVAAMDPSLGRNSWTLVVAGRSGRRISIALAREWKAAAGQTLDPAAILECVGRAIAPYKCRTVLTDQFQAEAIASIARRLNIGFEVIISKPTARERLERYEALALRLANGEIELPRDAIVRADLLSVRRRLSGRANEYTIHLQQIGRRHADYAPAITLATSRVGRLEAVPTNFYDYPRARSRAFGGVSGPTNGSDGRGGAMGL